MTPAFATHRTAALLPAAWNSAATSIFQTRDFLAHAERCNPCEQRYVSAVSGSLFAGAVIYRLTVNVLEFLGVRSPVRATVVGVPCSVSCSGLVGSADLWPALLQRIISETRGMLLCLNLDTPDFNHGMIPGKTLPSVVVEDVPSSWDGYLRTLRSDYRRRALKDRAALDAMLIRTGPCSGFDENLYGLYLQTLKHSKAALETLPMPFLRDLPAPFRLTHISDKGAVRCWHICVRDGKRLEFFLGGMNYEADDPRRTYRTLLASVLRTAMEQGATSINLGQTAETTKLRLGGALRRKYMLAWHHNPAVRTLLRVSRPVLEYRGVFPAHRVRKETP